ncbi:unnamed protein product [Durusdinium trenchii]|uniref:Peptidase M3A/M3B catalytic domain-containing protein n=2 Tax=Durusdinium trenchii TaxID=1381693 RepID=A0ABP0J7M8_9DINO
MSEVNLDIGVYEPMKKAEASHEFQEMSLEARTVLHHMRVSMEHEGIHLPAAEKEECIQLLDSEQQLSFDILNRQEQLRHQASEEGAWVPLASLGDFRGQVGGLPHRQDEVLIPRDSVLADHILKSPDQDARRRVYEAQQGRDKIGEEHMVSLLATRQRLAKIRGYESWAHYAQRDALFSSPQRVQNFLDSAWQQLRPGFVAELHLLSKEKKSLSNETHLQPWDVPYLLHLCKQKHKEADEISEYLTYASLMKGVELILSRLLGLQFTQEEPEAGELWHPSVQKYAIRDQDEILGILYLDPFQRAGKRVQSAQFTLQGSKLLDDGGRQTPKTCLVYALPPAARGLTAGFAATFMHEIGHAVHSLLSETQFQHLSGTRGTIDFVEFPSHLFEHFVLDPECLALYASHTGTGRELPQHLRQAHRRRPFSHFEAVQQLMYAAVDQAFFEFQPSAANPEKQVAEVHQHLHDS